MVECSICHIKQAWNVENKYAKEGRGLTEFNARGEGWKITADKDHNNDMVCICPLCVKALDSKSALQVIEALRPNLQDPEVKKILQTAFDELLKVNHLSNRGL